MHKKIPAIFVLIMITGILLSNSIFSFDGFPEQYFGNDVYGSGMGNTGLGDVFRINTSFSNPALPTTCNEVTFATAISLNKYYYSDSKDESFTDDGFDIPYFTVSIPYKNHRIAFNYNSVTSGIVEREIRTNKIGDDNEDDSYTINRIISGLYKADLIYANKNDFINFGLSANFYFGQKNQRYEINFDDEKYKDTIYEREVELKKSGFTLGLSKKIDKFGFGFVFQSKVKLQGDVNLLTSFYPYSEKQSESEYEIPHQISFASTYKISKRFKCSLDVNYGLWEKTSTYEESRNTTKISTGISYDPLWGYGNWYEKIPLRMGGYYRQLPFQYNNENIDELAVTFGFTIPLRSPKKRLEIGIELMKRGDLEINKIQDKMVSITIGTIGFDIFKKRVRKTSHRDIPKIGKGYTK